MGLARPCRGDHALNCHLLADIRTCAYQIGKGGDQLVLEFLSEADRLVRDTHNLKVTGSNPVPATKITHSVQSLIEAPSNKGNASLLGERVDT
jgi:hypothetical protein